MEQEAQRRVARQGQAVVQRDVSANLRRSQIGIGQERSRTMPGAGHADETGRVGPFDQAVGQPFGVVKQGSGSLSHAGRLEVPRPSGNTPCGEADAGLSLAAQ